MSNKLLIELDIEVDGRIAPQRLTQVLERHIAEAGPVLSESHGDGDAYFISINSVEVKEVV